MKFKTSSLIEAVDREVERRKAAAVESTEKARTEWEQNKAAWLDSDAPQRLRDEFKRLSERLRRGGTVTSDDMGLLGTGYYRSKTIPLYVGGNYPEEKAPNLGVLPSLREFLVTVTDEEVTSSGLRDVGFRDLASLFRTVKD